MFCWFKSCARRVHNDSILRRAVRRVLKEVRLPSMEQMEPRRLLSSSCSSTGVAPSIIVTYNGDAGGNSISASTSGVTLTITDGSLSCQFTQSDVATLNINGDSSGSGSDTITINTSVSVGTINVDGNDGNDLITGGNGAEDLTGGAGNDTLRPGAGNDTMDGTNGDDWVEYWTTSVGRTCNLGTGTCTTAASETDTLQNIDNLIGSTAADTLTGDGGHNRLRGFDGNDSISGGGGDDSLWGELGNDSVYGDDGDDVLNGDYDTQSGSEGADRIAGGSGIDLVDLSGRSNSLTITANDNTANDGASGEGDNIIDDIEKIVGGSAGDSITGNNLANSLVGGAGNDNLTGLDGSDSLVGGIGNDTLSGGADSDWFYVFDGYADTIDGGAGDLVNDNRDSLEGSDTYNNWR
jgi:Ca2+-binding RTX toxin-like protein